MKYYRILLVDDEPHIINMVMRLLDSIENMDLDIYYAYSATDAIDIIKKGRIDLLITDIQMPGMSGLELLQQINRFWSGTKAIVLTAYPEFQYAYEVFQQYAAGYLLKTEEKEIILKTILHTLEVIEQERHASYLSSVQQKTLSLNSDFSDNMHEQMDMLLQETDLLHILGFQTKGNLMLILCAASQPNSQAVSCMPHDFHTSLCHLLRIHFQKMIRHSICYQDSNGYVLFLAQLSDSISAVQTAEGWASGILENIQDILASTGQRLPFLYGTSASLAGVFSLYQSALTRLSNILQDFPASWIFCLDSPAQASNSQSSLVDFLKNYIETHAAEDLSLLRLSEITGYNTSYISWIFHNETGIRLNRYISQKKLDLINSYLTNPSFSINDVIEKTGFNSRRYFNIFIKRETGMIPKEYRASLLRK
ncbi:MAG TPA: response regulator [Candidatus Eisenbergiella merdipullorum]|uniref:Stage 0 sporulation protein A homolog n=1 Tax=Candidatus Eisenbergiella merdipullorum TaxID=2838553 RepID=A0A9D2I6Y8_9FIRM|nr:response regulator [Candidatus Eisenbergiella merdipullorum]